MDNQKAFDKIQAIARKYEIIVEVNEVYGDFILKSFTSTPMINDLQQEFCSVYYNGENTPKELRGMTISTIRD